MRIFFLPYNHAKIISNVHTLKDIKNRGHRLSSTYEQKLEKKLRTAINFNSEIIDFNEKLQAENLEYLEREKDIENKINQLNASSVKVRSQLISEWKSHSESQRELEAKYTAKIKSFKSSIRILKRERTLAQKALSADKDQILSLEVKVRELEGKLDDLELEQAFHDSLKLELERANGDLNSKKHEIDALSSMRLNLTKENSHLQEIISKKDKEIKDLSNLPPLPMNDS